MADTDLKDFAYHLFLLLRREVWLGGKTVADDSRDWPRDVEYPWTGGGSGKVFWTLSPEIVLGGHKLRICISSRELNYTERYHKLCVRIFVDGVVKHPGGKYEVSESIFPLWLYESWECMIARQEREDGGRTGPIDQRDLLLAEAKQRLNGPSKVKKSDRDDLLREAMHEAGSKARKEAEAEIEDMLRNVKL